MPGFYRDGEYDVAGFIVGAVDRSEIIDGSGVRKGDLLIALPSVGLHTNGYSLARKLFFEVATYKADTYVEELGCTVAEELLKPHRSYLGPIGPMLGWGAIKGLVHITGGGLLENIPRILPQGLAAEIRLGSWPVLPVFELMQRIGNVADAEMQRTFNCGVGMIIVVSPEDADRVRACLDEQGEKHYDIGCICEGPQSVFIKR
jgi:phosphoribosylformylglycinamidine cyclo-ligase